MKLEGRRVITKDGRKGQLGKTIIKHRSGWEYFVHMDDGKLDVLSRGDFKYLPLGR